MRVQKQETLSVIFLEQDLIYNHFSGIINTVQTLIKENTQVIVFDMQGVEYVSAKGLDFILDLAQKIRKAGKEIKLVNLSGELSRLFKMTGVNKGIEIKQDTAEIDTAGISEIERDVIRDLF